MKGKSKQNVVQDELEILIFELWQEKAAQYAGQFSIAITLNWKLAAKKNPVIMPNY